MRAGNDRAAEIIHDRNRINRVWAEQMVLNVPDIDGPDLVPPRGLKGHLLEGVRLLLRTFQAIETPVESSYPSACPGREFDPDVLEGSMYPPFTQFGVLLQFANFVHAFQCHFSSGMLGCVAFVIKPSDALFHPPLEGSMDGLITGLHIAGNAGNMQPFRMEANDSQAAFSRVLDLRPG